MKKNKLWRKFFLFGQWFIAFRSQRNFSLQLDMEGFKIIEPPAGRFYADPFLFDNNGRNYIFFEEYIALKDKGVISVVEIDQQGNYSKPAIVLEKEHHLSYPFIFEIDDAIYMLPETGDNRTIELYQAVTFPYEWKLAKVMLTGIRAVDSNILHYQGKYWLFTTVLEEDDIYGKGKLYIYYADSIFSDWQEHSCNPVNSNLSSSRSAGRLFFSNNRLFRPSQYSSDRYGEAIILNEIKELSESNYSELSVMKFGPEWLLHNKALHTYNRNGYYEVIDGMILKTDLCKVFRRVASIIYRFVSNFRNSQDRSRNNML